MEMHLGIVEDNNDPQKIGRVRVRIPSKHGVGDEGLDTEALTWVEPVTPFYSGYQYGSYSVPRVGSMVWVISHEDSGAIYLGSAHGIGSTGEKLFNGSQVPEGEQEVPSIINDENYTTSTVLYQSPGGNVVLAVTNDEKVIIKAGDSKITMSDDGIIDITAKQVRVDKA